MLLDWVSQDPKPSASVLQGLFYGRVAPPQEREDDPADARDRPLPRPDPSFSDSDMLVRELPNARLVQASSILELRLTPERLTGEIVEFVGECFKPARASGSGAAADPGPLAAAARGARPLSRRLRGGR